MSKRVRITNKPKKLSESRILSARQEEEIYRMAKKAFWKQAGIFGIIFGTISVLGLISLWQSTQKKILEEFAQPRIQETIKQAAEGESKDLLIETLNPTVEKFDSDLRAIARSIVAYQYYDYKGRNSIPSPYQYYQEKAIREMFKAAVPDPDERDKIAEQLDLRPGNFKAYEKLPNNEKFNLSE